MQIGRKFKSSKFKEFNIQRVRKSKSSKNKEFEIQRVRNSKSSNFKEFKEFENHSKRRVQKLYVQIGRKFKSSKIEFELVNFSFI